MELTEVKVRKLNVPTGKLKAAATIILDNEFAVSDIQIIEGANGLFVAMPSRKVVEHTTGKRRFRDVAYPLNSATREKIYSAVMKEFDNLMKTTGNTEEYTWEIQ